MCILEAVESVSTHTYALRDITGIMKAGIP